MSLDILGSDSLREFMHLACGELLGKGMSRTTYRYALDPTKVIKIENSIPHFQNVREWLIWQDNQYCKDINKYLCPCHYISHSGTFLIMDYARNLTASEVPDKLPTFATDLKITNLGMLPNGRVVLRDYGTTSTNLNKRLVNAKNRVNLQGEV